MTRSGGLRWRMLVLATAGALAVTLSGCSPTAPTGEGAGTSVEEPDATAEDTGDEVEDAGDDGSGEFVVVAGTGRYAVGTDIPFGGYQLSGEPASQPDGCTWSIQDADGAVAFENQGSYAFLTDIPEGSVFVTDGCPDWEQFE